MAERRMFTQKITESDAFIEMPMSSQALYFHLCMNADDDGFVKNPKSIQRLVGCNDDDLKLLIVKRFVLTYESGVIVIKHWRMHNILRKDRYKETEYLEEKSSLYLKENGAYTFDETQGKPIPKISEKPSGNQMATKWQPTVYQMAPQDRLDIYHHQDILESKSNITTLNKKIDDDDSNISCLIELKRQYPQIQNDITSTAFVDEPDYAKIIERFAESEYLRTKCVSLSWIIKNHKKIESGFYADKPNSSQQDNNPVAFLEWEQDESGAWRPKK